MTDTRTITIANRGGATYRVDPRRPLLDSVARTGRRSSLRLQIWRLHHLCGQADRRRSRSAPAGGAEQSSDQQWLRVLLCVARPLSDCTLEIGVESHDKLYRNPFLDPLEPHELKADIATPKEA